jgi:hypothetical protein
MTPRRRRPSGSSGSSGSTHHPPGGDRATPSRRTGSGGHAGVGTDVDGIDAMASRLDATRGRVDGVASTVRGVNLGPQSMGIVGSGFTGAAQGHLRTAEQHLARTTQAVEQAHRGTRATAQSYRDTDNTNATNLSRIDSTTNPRTTHSAAATTPSSTTPTGASPTSPPTTPSGGPPGGAALPPGPPPGGSAGGTPPGGGPGGPGGGHPGAGGTPGGGTPPHRESWTDTIRRNFSNEEYHRFTKALRKMAEDPSEPGRVAGSGALTPRERELMARAQALVTIEPDTPMRKVVPPGDVPKILSGDYDSVGGFVSRAQDGPHLTTPDDVVQGNRLDYRNSPFQPGMADVTVVEFPATDPSRYQTPFGAPQDMETNLPENSPAVRRAADDMVESAERAGVDPATYGRYISDWPYSGVGVTADAQLGIPERRMPDRMPYPDGSVMYQYDTAGNRSVVAVYHDGLGWVPPTSAAP